MFKCVSVSSLLHPLAENKPHLVIMKLSSSIYSTVFFSLSTMGFFRAQKPLNFPITARSTPHDSGKNNQPELNAVSKASQFLSSRLQKGVTLRMPRLVCLMV